MPQDFDRPGCLILHCRHFRLIPGRLSYLSHALSKLNDWLFILVRRTLASSPVLFPQASVAERDYSRSRLFANKGAPYGNISLDCERFIRSR
jgi:hypothetical protein